MNKLCKYLKLILLMAFMLGGMVLNAQEAKMMRALNLYNGKKPDQARLCIDSVITHSDTKGKAEVWTLRAYIYFDIYKRGAEKTKFKSTLRDTIISSLKRSYSLKPDQESKANNDKLANVIAGQYSNIAKHYMEDSLNYDMSNKAFILSKEITKLAEPNFDFKAKDKEYYQAAGYIYSDLFNKDKKNYKAFEIAKVALLKVLEINPNDTAANMNMGIMYLNQATDLIESVEAGDVSIEQLDMLIENSVKLAKQAEQFMLKVYNQNPKNKKAVLALYYVYRILNDDAKMQQFEAKCKELKIEVTDDSSKQKK